MYERLELRDVHLSHASGLYLLQGASIRGLLDGIMVWPLAFVGNVGSSDAPALSKPPLVIRKLVLVHVLEKPENLDGEELTKQIFFMECTAPNS